MRLSALLLMCLMAGACAGTALAQPSSAPSQQLQKESGKPSVIGPGVQHNIASIGKMMREIHQLMCRQCLSLTRNQKDDGHLVDGG